MTSEATGGGHLPATESVCTLHIPPCRRASSPLPSPSHPGLPPARPNEFSRNPWWNLKRDFVSITVTYKHIMKCGKQRRKNSRLPKCLLFLLSSLVCQLFSGLSQIMILKHVPAFSLPGSRRESGCVRFNRASGEMGVLPAYLN